MIINHLLFNSVCLSFNNASRKNCVLAKDVISCTYCFYIRYILILQVGGMLWPQKGATHNHVQFQTKVVQSKVWLSAIFICVMARIYNLWDGYLDKRKVRNRFGRHTGEKRLFHYGVNLSY